MPEKPDAIVIGAGVNALGVLRILGRQGLRLALVSDHEGGIATRSRYAHASIALEPGMFSAKNIAHALDLGSSQPVLFLTQENDVAGCLVSPHAWDKLFKTYFYTPNVARRLLDKAEFQKIASESGVSITRARVLRSREDIQSVRQLSPPYVVKPLVRSQEFMATGYKAHKVADLKSAIELCSHVVDIGVECIVQEWVDGRDTDIYFNTLFVDADGELGASFVGRKVLCWPPKVGGTAACVASPENHEELTSVSLDFLTKIGFRGFIGLEYKKTVDGRYCMIEPTVYRTDYQHEISAINGCDILSHIFAYCHGRAVRPTQTSGSKRYWIDRPAAALSRATGESDMSLLKGKKAVSAWFRLYDPKPGIVAVFQRMRHRIRKRLQMWRT